MKVQLNPPSPSDKIKVERGKLYHIEWDSGRYIAAVNHHDYFVTLVTAAGSPAEFFVILNPLEVKIIVEYKGAITFDNR